MCISVYERCLFSCLDSFVFVFSALCDCGRVCLCVLCGCLNMDTLTSVNTWSNTGGTVNTMHPINVNCVATVSKLHAGALLRALLCLLHARHRSALLRFCSGRAAIESYGRQSNHTPTLLLLLLLLTRGRPSGVIRVE